jgi:hypothetical protein
MHKTGLGTVARHQNKTCKEGELSAGGITLAAIRAQSRDHGGATAKIVKDFDRSNNK